MLEDHLKAMSYLKKLLWKVLEELIEDQVQKIEDIYERVLYEAKLGSAQITGRSS